ncbi:MAG: M16 family metallopeptidase [Thermodesulfobacteriota bacterium]
MYRKSVLSNGLRIVTEEVPHFHSVAVGVWLSVGSRDETEEESGLSHFLEHMVFKGTPRRTVLDIAREIDHLGGQCNAFTTKEQTCFHGRVLGENLPRLVDLLGDLVLRAQLAAPDLERERQVILEEIYAQDDSPEELVHVHFAQNFWGDNAFGRPILGAAEHISRVKREDLLAYRAQVYRPASTVVAAAGKIRHEELVDLVGAGFQDFSNGTPARPRVPFSTHPGTYSLFRELEQVNLVLGVPGVAAGDPMRYAATMLQLILGGNMSSRLFQVIREQLGLAYAIQSYIQFFSDAGLLGIVAGVSPGNLEAILAAIRGELKKLQAEAVSGGELTAAQEHLRSSIMLSAEDCEHLMLRLAKNEINFGRYIPLEDIIAGMMKVTAAEILEAARDLLRPEAWGLALLGPVADPDKYGLA